MARTREAESLDSLGRENTDAPARSGDCPIPEKRTEIILNDRSVLPSHWYVIRLGSLGDVVLTTGPLAWWYRTRGWTFTIITRKAFTPLFVGHPAVIRVIGLGNEDLRMCRLIPFFRTLSIEGTGSGLLDLHGVLRSRLLCLLWRGPVRYSAKYGLERRLFLASGGLFFRERLNACTVPQRYACAVETEPPPRYFLLPHIRLDREEQQQGQCHIKKLCDSKRAAAVVALHPYAAHSDKAWPLEAWQELIAHLTSVGLTWFIIGQGNNERLTGVAAEHDFTNRTSLRETCALLQAADVLITGDSGPMHLACAVGTPVVAIFGPTSAEWGFMPGGPHDQILEPPPTKEFSCRPCSLHGRTGCRKGRLCMRSITPERVLDALHVLLQKIKQESWAV